MLCMIGKATGKTETGVWRVAFLINGKQNGKDGRTGTKNLAGVCVDSGEILSTIIL